MASTRPLARPSNLNVFVAAPLEQHLERYREAGFAVSDYIAHWDPGLRNGFVMLWPESLELITVADEHAFGRDADRDLCEDRAVRGIHAFELLSADTHAVHARLSERGVVLPAVQEARMANTPAAADADFAYVGLEHLPGSTVTTMTSAHDSPMYHQIRVAPNGVFALGGVTMVVDDPVAALNAWRPVVDPAVHDLDFVTAAQWQTRCPDADSPVGVACVHLLSEDVDTTVSSMVDAGWEQGQHIGGRPQLLPHPADNVRYTVREGSADQWALRRRHVLGEDLRIARDEPAS